VESQQVLLGIRRVVDGRAAVGKNLLSDPDQTVTLSEQQLERLMIEAGVLGKLYAESCENVRRPPVQALEATGASRLAVACYAILPLASGPMAIHTLFRLEWNLRAATVVGMIGAGGIGQALYNAQQLFAYKQMMAYIFITWGIVLVSEWLSKVTRDRYGWSVYC